MVGNRALPKLGGRPTFGKRNLALLLGVAASLLLGACAGTPAPRPQPVAEQPPQPSGPSAAEQQLQSDLERAQSQREALQARLDNADNRVAELEKTNEALTAENRTLTDALGRVAFDKGVPQEQLLREGLAAGGTGSSRPSAQAASLTAGSVVADNLDPETGIHTLVDLRANASTGNSLFLSLRVKDGESPSASLTIQRRYPESDPLFLVRSVTLVAGGRAIPVPLDRFTVARYRSGPFRIEAITTSDASVIVTLVTAILADTEIGDDSPASQVTIRESGIQQEYSRELTPDELRALSNMVYVYRELGGRTPSR